MAAKASEVHHEWIRTVSGGLFDPSARQFTRSVAGAPEGVDGEVDGSKPGPPDVVAMADAAPKDLIDYYKKEFKADATMLVLFPDDPSAYEPLKQFRARWETIKPRYRGLASMIDRSISPEDDKKHGVLEQSPSALKKLADADYEHMCKHLTSDHPDLDVAFNDLGMVESYTNQALALIKRAKDMTSGAAGPQVADTDAQVGAAPTVQANAGKAAPATSAQAADDGKAMAAAPDRAKTMARTIAEQIGKVKDAALQEFAAADPKLLAAVQEDMKELDRVAAMFDHALAESLQDLSGASDAAARQTATGKVKAELGKLLQIAKSEPLIAHIDDNPFGIKTDIVGKLSEIGKHVLTLTG